MKVRNPCPNASLSLQASPFKNEISGLGEAETIQSYDVNSMVLTDAIVNCGAYDIAFYLNDGLKTSLDATIFDVRQSTSEFVRLFSTDYDQLGVYEILYAISYSDYRSVSVE